MESQIRRFDADLAKNFQVFLDEGWGEALVKKGRVGLSRTLVVEESVSPDAGFSFTGGRC